MIIISLRCTSFIRNTFRCCKYLTKCKEHNLWLWIVISIVLVALEGRMCTAVIFISSIIERQGQWSIKKAKSLYIYIYIYKTRTANRNIYAGIPLLLIMCALVYIFSVFSLLLYNSASQTFQHRDPIFRTTTYRDSHSFTGQKKSRSKKKKI
jgi:hypothetical protein